MEEGKGSCNKRETKYRSKRSQTIVKRINSAKKEQNQIKIKIKSFKDTYSGREFSIMGAKPSPQREPYIASIAMGPHCPCLDFLKNGNSGPCKHLIWLYIFVFKVNEEDPLLQQKSLTSEELTQLLADYKIEERYICSEKRAPSRFEECKKLLREDYRFANYSHEWKLMKKKKKRGRAPQCQTCKTTIQENMSCLLCCALYVPYEQHFVRPRERLLLLPVEVMHQSSTVLH